ncbi:MAG: carboxypeptidase regulatory-like domain-containing protein, partial [Calditrichota bacterium]
NNGGSTCAQGAVISTFTDGNSFYDVNIYRHWFDRGEYSLGFADIGTISEMVTRYDRDPYPCIGRCNARAYIWLGDPALEIRQAAVDLRVDAPELIPLRARSVAFDVTDQDGNGVEAARVCLHTDNDEVYLTAETDVQGRTVIFFDPLIEEAATLNWGVYNRNVIPAFGEILVAEAFGALEGRVTDLADGQPVEGAEINLIRFDLMDATDVQGDYRIEGIPAGDYDIYLTAPGYLDQNAFVHIVDEQVTRQDFALRFCLLEATPSRITQRVENGRDGSTNLILSNIGNGILTWNAALSYPGDAEPFTLLRSDDLVETVNDDRLMGVVFVNNLYYISGANHLAFPNYIYVLNRNLEFVRRFEQPAECAGMGIHDLAWDGEYLYGSSNRDIYQFTTDGEFLGHWQGPYDPNTALAYDGEGQFWVGNNRANLIRIDREGNQTATINNALPVRALAWYPLDPEGFYLFMWVRGEDGATVSLYQANPASGETRLARNLTLAVGDLPLDGLFITSDYIPASWTILGMVSQPGQCLLRHWLLEYARGWLSLDTLEGIIQPEESQELILSYQTEGYAHDQELRANIEISNNGRVPQVVVTFSLLVGNVPVVPLENEVEPNQFSLAEVFPNPFNSVVQIRVDLPQAGELRVEVFDLTGRRQAVLAEGWQSSGRHWFTLNGEGLPSGIYIVQASSPQGRSSLKIALLR